MASLATTYHQQVLELRREVLGEKHPDTIWKLRRGVLGEKHPDSLQAMHDLAITWNSRGRRDDAIGLMNKSQRLRQTVLGPDHPFTKQSAQFLESWENGRCHGANLTS
ncbi:hypothetical protein V8F06_014944 [Rhypophila decipiens]